MSSQSATLPDVKLVPETLAAIINSKNGINRKDLAKALDADESAGELRVALGELLVGNYVTMERDKNEILYCPTARGRANLPQEA